MGSFCRCLNLSTSISDCLTLSNSIGVKSNFDCKQSSPILQSQSLLQISIFSLLIWHHLPSFVDHFLVISFFCIFRNYLYFPFRFDEMLKTFSDMAFDVESDGRSFFNVFSFISFYYQLCRYELYRSILSFQVVYLLSFLQKSISMHQSMVEILILP